MSLYSEDIAKRSKIKFLIGLYPRVKRYIIQEYFINRIARNKGASIGKNVNISKSLAKRANSNLIIGDNVSIQTDNIDLRAQVHIGNNVIIGKDVEIITCSHNVDSPDWEHKSYGINIEDYVWLATRTFILPSCRKIEYGAVCAAGAVVVKNVEKMSIVAGNPATFLKNRKCVHYKLVVESLLGNDLIAYVNEYQTNKNA